MPPGPTKTAIILEVINAIPILIKMLKLFKEEILNN